MTRGRWIPWLLGAWILVLIVVAISATPARVRFVSGPFVVSETALVRYAVYVPIHPENRLLVLVAFDGDFPVQYSEFDLSRERNRAEWATTWRLPPGEIVLVAALYGVREDAWQQLARDVRRVLVQARF